MVKRYILQGKKKRKIIKKIHISKDNSINFRTCGSSLALRLHDNIHPISKIIIRWRGRVLSLSFLNASHHAPQLKQTVYHDIYHGDSSQQAGLKQPSRNATLARDWIEPATNTVVKLAHLGLVEITHE